MDEKKLEERFTQCESRQRIHLGQTDDKGESKFSLSVNEEEGRFIFEGDMIVAYDDPFVEKGNISIEILRWPSNKIYYAFDESMPDGPVRRAIVLIINEQFNARTNLELTPLPEDLIDEPHIYFIQSTKNWSIVGYRKDEIEHECHIDKQFDWDTAAHEIGHAVGLWHEHTRTDRDDYIEIVWENVRDEAICSFVKRPEWTQPHGPYDYDSIMHYKPIGSGLSINMKEPIMKARMDPTVNPEGKDISMDMDIKKGPNNLPKLSAGDIAAINAMYPLDV